MTESVLLGAIVRNRLSVYCIELARTMQAQCYSATSNIEADARIVISPKKGVEHPLSMADFVESRANVFAQVDTLPKSEFENLCKGFPLRKAQVVLCLYFEVRSSSNLVYLSFKKPIILNRYRDCKNILRLARKLENKIAKDLYINPICKAIISK